METVRIPVDPHQPEPAVITRAADVLRHGGLVVFPTETVYGLGALADDSVAAARIFTAKGRPGTNPLIAHVPDIAMARRLASAWPPAAEALARAFWPGPLTLVVPRDPTVIPDVVSAGASTVAVRAPAHPVALALLTAVGRPLAAPSANRYQAVSATTADHVLKTLSGRVDMVLDGGPCRYGIESTVVDTTRDPPVVLRPGALALGDLQDVLPGITLHRGVIPEGVTAPSPGMHRKHYAPRARLVIAARDQIAPAVAAARTVGTVGVIVVSPMDLPMELEGAVVRWLPDHPYGYAAGFFSALHALDDLGCATVVVAAVPDEPPWAAVRDRMDRARS